MFVVIKNEATLKRIYNTNKEIFDEANLELSTSNNKKTIKNKKTKIIIVGTITPYSGNGFFYTSNGRMYEKVIDPILNTRLYEDYCKDKNQLSDEEINELAKKINKKVLPF